MIRLPPSELTLTAEDVEETFRRMAERRASKQHERPVLRRGPQRAVRNAIVDSNIDSALHTKFQRAQVVDAKDRLKESTAHLASNVDGSMDGQPPNPFATSLPRPATACEASPEELRVSQLPFRTGRSKQESDFAHETKDISKQAAISLCHSSSACSTSTPVPFLQPAKDDCEMPIAANAQSGVAELRGGSGSGTDYHHALRGRTAPNLLASQQASRQDSHVDPLPSSQFRMKRGNETSTLHLQGSFKPVRDPPAVAVTEHMKVPSFVEDMPYEVLEMTAHCIRTEPRRRAGQQSTLKRSLSTGSRPPGFRIPLPDPIAADSSNARLTTQATRCHTDLYSSRTSSGQTSLRPQPSSLPDSNFLDHTRARSRQFSSEISSTSGAFSLYELPQESRNTSNESKFDQKFHSRFDGAGVSRPDDRGTYRSVGVSEARALSDKFQQPSLSKPLSPAPSEPPSRTQGEFSSLPALPYGRQQDVTRQRRAQASLDNPTIKHHSGAVAAAIHNVPSPLDVWDHQIPKLGASLHSLHEGKGSGHQTTNRANRSQTNCQQVLRRERTTDGNQHDSVTSSEGVFLVNVQSTSQTYHQLNTRRSQVQMHTAAYERLQNSQRALLRHMDHSDNVVDAVAQVQDRHQNGIDQGHHHANFQGRRATDGHDRSTSLHSNPSANSHSASLLPVVGRFSEALRDPFSATHQLSLDVVPYGAHGNNIQPTGSRNSRVILPTQMASLGRYPHLPSSFDTGSIRTLTDAHNFAGSRNSVPRRSLSTQASGITHIRRLPPQQRDQENSGSGEAALMRQEEDAIQARYGGLGGGETLNETPPRVGRIERRMLG